MYTTYGWGIQVFESLIIIYYRYICDRLWSTSTTCWWFIQVFASLVIICYCYTCDRLWSTSTTCGWGIQVFESLIIISIVLPVTGYGACPLPVGGAGPGGSGGVPAVS